MKRWSRGWKRRPGRGPWAARLFSQSCCECRSPCGAGSERLRAASCFRRSIAASGSAAAGLGRREARRTSDLEARGARFQTLSGYGLAETASAFTGNTPEARRIGSEGKPLGKGRVRIANAGLEGTGEIQLQGPAVFDGYLDNPEANRAAFTEDGWFRTGDLGRLDEDGYVYVEGRLKELIVLGGGKNVFPEELEKCYGLSPFIKEVAVLERNGGLVALVVPDTAAIRASPITSIEAVVRVTSPKRRKLCRAISACPVSPSHASRCRALGSASTSAIYRGCMRRRWPDALPYRSRSCPRRIRGYSPGPERRRHGASCKPAMARAV